VVFQEILRAAWKGFLSLPTHAEKELGENIALVKDYSHYGKISTSKQSESDVHIEAIKGQKLASLADFVKANAPWE